MYGPKAACVALALATAWGHKVNTTTIKRLSKRALRSLINQSEGLNVGLNQAQTIIDAGKVAHTASAVQPRGVYRYYTFVGLLSAI